MVLRALVVVLASLSAANGLAESEADVVPSMNNYVTCAVYFRMAAAALTDRFGSGKQQLAQIEKEKMFKMITKGKSTATREYGDEQFGEEMFQDRWNAMFLDMTNQINRNYENISRLKYRYRIRCQNLLDESSVIGAQ